MKTFIKFIFVTSLIILIQDSYAQVGINATGAAPDSKAMLDINSTSKGFLWPRMTLAQRNAISTAPGVTPEGLTIFDTDTKNLWIYKNAAWQPYLQSPWEINGNDIYNSNAGNVGIGTFTPTAKLDITTNSLGNTAIFNGGNSMWVWLAENGLKRGYVGSYSGNAEDVDLGTSSFNPTGKLHFAIQAVPKLTVIPNGNVGIGTTDPVNKLHILNNANSIITNEITSGNQASLELKTNGNVYDFLELRKWSNTSGGFYGSVVTPTSIPLSGLSEISSGSFTTGGVLLSTKNATPLYFATNGSEKMRITADGDVGIGTTIPTQKLDIDGQIRIRGGNPDYGKVLTSNADGTANWVTPIPTLVPHNHLGETWTGNVTYGLELINNNTAAGAVGFRGRMSGGGTAYNSAIDGLSNSSNGRGVFGGNSSTGFFPPPIGNAGVAGVAGNGTGVYGASISGPSIYGYKGATSSTGNVGIFENANATNTDPVVLITNTNANPNPTALELNNGYLKVSGINKTAFVITAGTGSTIVANRVRFSYPGMSSTDILIVNHQYVGAYIGAVGNWYDTAVNQWSIFREDLASMPAGEKFTVLVIKQ